MKKLVLLVSVFLLVAGMVAADVTFAPAVTGSTSLTWGMDLKVADAEMNSGFDTASSTSLDLGVTVDPVDAKGGEGIYGEVAISGLAVTAKSGADVTVAAPSIAAKLWFSEALYAFIDTDGIMSDYAAPMGKMTDFAADNDIKGSWYDDGKTKIKADYGNAGAGFTYMAGDLTATLSFVSNDKWGTSDADKAKLKLATYNVATAGDDSMTPAEIGAAESAANAYDADGNTYKVVVLGPDATVAGEYVVKVDDSTDKNIFFNVFDKDGKFVEESKEVFVDAPKTNTSLYTAGLDVAYTLTDVGTFKAYVAPTHDSATKMFDNIFFGVEAAISLASFDMVGLTVGADFALDNSETVAEEKFDYEVAVTVPVKVGDLLAANFKAAFTDAAAGDDNMPLDLYADATLTAAGATVTGAYMVANFAEANAMTQMYKVSASYPVAVGAGTVTPMVSWEQDMVKPEQGLDAQKAVLTASVAAAIIDNVTFTAKYVSGDMLVASGAKVDPGVFTFVTAFAY